MLSVQQSTKQLTDLTKKALIKNNYFQESDLTKVSMFFKKKNLSQEHRSWRALEVDKDRFAGQKEQGQPSKQLSFSTGYSKEIFQYTLSVNRLLAEEQLDSITQLDLFSFCTDVGKDLYDKIELNLRNVFTFMNAASYTDQDGYTKDLTGGDGLPPISGNHTLKNVSNVYSNNLTGNPVLTPSSYFAAQDYFKYSVFDNNGQLLEANPNVIFTTQKSSQMARVKVLFGKSTVVSFDQNGALISTNGNANVPNLVSDEPMHIAFKFDRDQFNLPDQTKSFWWGLAQVSNGSEMGMGLEWYHLIFRPVKINPMYSDYDRMTKSFTGNVIMGIGTVTSKHIVVSFATS